MDAEKAKVLKLVGKVLGAIGLTLLPWLLDKLQAFEKLSPKISGWLGSSFSVPTWLVLSLLILLVFAGIVLWRQAGAVAVAAIPPPPEPAPITAPPPAVPQAVAPNFSPAEKAVLAHMKRATRALSAEAVSGDISRAGNFTAPQITAAFTAIYQKGLMDFQLADDLRARYSLTQAGYNAADEMEQAG